MIPWKILRDVHWYVWDNLSHVRPLHMDFLTDAVLLFVLCHFQRSRSFCFLSVCIFSPFIIVCTLPLYILAFILVAYFSVICLTYFHIYPPNPGQTKTTSRRPSSWCYQGLVYAQQIQHFVFMLLGSWMNVDLLSFLWHFLQALTTWDKCFVFRWASLTRILWPSLVGIPWFVLKPKILSCILILLGRILFVAWNAVSVSVRIKRMKCSLWTIIQLLHWVHSFAPWHSITGKVPQGEVRIWGTLDRKSSHIWQLVLQVRLLIFPFSIHCWLKLLTSY